MTLPPHLATFLAELRADPRLGQLLQCYVRTPQVGWKSFADDPKAEAQWAYRSGKLDGEKSLLLWLAGYDPDSRQSG